MVYSRTRFVSVAFLAAMAVPSPGMSMSFATDTAHMLEKAYISDCIADTSPHGYYGAFLQPCEFIFRQADDAHMVLQKGGQDMCSDEVSKIVARPTPMNWFFNLTEHFDKEDWDEISSDDFDELADKLMLWPDQCVGVQARCYSVVDSVVRDTLNKIFDNKIPEGATHVYVNCQNDAMALTRVIYAFADGFQKSLPTIIFWALTVVLLSLVASLWCCYACFRLCRRDERSCTSTTSVMISPKMTRDNYMAIDDLKEVELLVKK